MTTTPVAPPASRIVATAVARVIVLGRLVGCGAVVAIELITTGDRRLVALIGVLVVVTGVQALLVRRFSRRGDSALLVVGIDTAALLAVLALGQGGPEYYFYAAAAASLAGALIGVTAIPVWLALAVQEYVASITMLRTPGVDVGPVPVMLAAPTMAVFFGVLTALGLQALTWQLVGAAERVAAARTSAAADERSRLAREMHDSIATTLHGVSLAAALLPDVVEREPRRARELAEQISRGARAATQEARDLVQGLRLDHTGADLDRALTDLATAWSQQSGVPVRVDVTPIGPAGPAGAGPAVEHEVTRIVHEALTNVARHAAASGVDVRLTSLREGGLELLVHDDGRGFAVPADLGDLPRDGHAGIVGMAERAAGLGGRFEITSTPGHGTSIRVTVPE